MSGQTSEWGDADQVSSVDLVATDPDGKPLVIMPALQGTAQQPVVVTGPALVDAAASQIPSTISITDQNGLGMTDNAGNPLIIG